jgi:hypothetical protein
MDKDGTLLYSDEINHSVVCLDHRGCLLWHKTGLGTGPGQMYYPKGLSLGWIEKEGHAQYCLAVSDSWNRRVQFMDLEGNPLEVWAQGGQTPFVEVTDIRFISGKFCTDPASGYSAFWLVLDKGNHRLFGIGPEGKLLFQMGRCLAPTMEGRWAIPPMFIERALRQPGFTENLPAFDLTFYPERILGDSESALYLLESYSRRLRQVLFDNLFPVRIETEDPLDWVAADTQGILGWHRPTSRLMRYDCHLDPSDHVEIHGQPIASNLSTSEFWVQREELIERWKWCTPDPAPSQPRPAGICVSLAGTVEAELELFDADRVHRAIADLTMVLDEGLTLVDEILWLGAGNLRPQQLQDVLEHIRVLPERRVKPLQDLYEALHHWSLGLLEYGLSGIGTEELTQKVTYARRGWEACACPIRDRYVQLQNRLENLMTMRMNLPGAMAHDPCYAEVWKKAALGAEADQQRVAEWIRDWSRVEERCRTGAPREPY